jgi:hypothetical protein
VLAESRDVARRLLKIAFEPDDWIAIFLKAHDTGLVSQRIAPVAMFYEPRWQAWLRVMNAHRFNVYVSVNAMTPGRRQRTKEAVRAVRHVFLDVDRDGAELLSALPGRHDVPCPSYVIHSSPGRMHLLWRVSGFSRAGVEELQKRLARELSTDPAATSCTQTTRLPGFLNLKYARTVRVSVEYRAREAVYGPGDFPGPDAPPASAIREASPGRNRPGEPTDVLERARRYLAAVPPAVAGQRGDARTFHICCRLTRGFALSARDALALLTDWNACCEPPWSERELLAKLAHAQRYGREPVGGLLGRGP